MCPLILTFVSLFLVASLSPYILSYYALIVCHVLFCAGKGCLGNPDSVFDKFAHSLKVCFDNI